MDLKLGFVELPHFIPMTVSGFENSSIQLILPGVNVKQLISWYISGSGDSMSFLSTKVVVVGESVLIHLHH